MPETSERNEKQVHRPPESDSAEIRELYRMFCSRKAPALIGPEGEHIPIPDSVFHVFRQVLGYMKQGKGVSVIPVMEELTTQRAANILGVSRPFLIDLLNQGKIAFHKAGTHRRIYLRDLIEYQAARDKERTMILDNLAKDSVSAGDYDQIYIPDSGE
ncbi:MAG TPA: helix-turn-helix domain-containing protein [Terriglobales bacterium]|nr:helix-turn-helix domain-containing protein [Terriglobales bacterium]